MPKQFDRTFVVVIVVVLGYFMILCDKNLFNTKLCISATKSTNINDGRLYREIEQRGSFAEAKLNQVVKGATYRKVVDHEKNKERENHVRACCSGPHRRSCTDSV